jgi:hypothetical protein
MRKSSLSLLALFFYTSVFSQVVDMNELVFCAYHKIEKIELKKDYLAKFLESHNSYEVAGKKSNEFEYQKYLDQKIIFYKNIIDTLNLNNIFTYNTSIFLNKYDFEKQGFPFQPVRFFPNEDVRFYDFICYPPNGVDYNFLNIDSEKADILLKQIQNNYKSSNNQIVQRYGPDLSREINATYKFSFTGEVKVQEYERYSIDHYEVIAICNIIELRLYGKDINSIYVKPNK